MESTDKLTDPRWVVHLPTSLPDLDVAIELVDAMRSSLGHVDVLDFGEVTLSPEDRQSTRTRVWCDARTAAGGPRRCRRFDGHAGPCDPRDE